jgi:hypothetical protein
MNLLNPYDIKLEREKQAIAPGFAKWGGVADWREWSKSSVETWRDGTTDVLNTVADLPTALREQLIATLRSGDAARWYAIDHNLSDTTVEGVKVRTVCDNRLA